MKENFQASLAAVLKSEGGNDDDPQDHGGRTSRGITQREYDAWCKEKGFSTGDVWQAPQQFIEEIYHDEYWAPECDGLPKGVDYLLFNMKVNAGLHRAIVLLQQALGVTDDGRMGPITRQAVAHADPIALITRYTIASQDFYRALHQPRFLKGWLARALEVKATAIAMAKENGNGS